MTENAISSVVPRPRSAVPDPIVELRQLATSFAAYERRLVGCVRELSRRGAFQARGVTAEQALASLLGWDVERAKALLRDGGRRAHPAGKRVRARELEWANT